MPKQNEKQHSSYLEAEKVDLADEENRILATKYWEGKIEGH